MKPQVKGPLPIRDEGRCDTWGRSTAAKYSSCSPERFELVPEAVQGRPGEIGRDVGVDLHRHGDLAVSQDLHGDAGVDVQGGQQGPAGMAGPMDGDRTYPGLGRPCFEGPVEVVGVKGQTVAGW
jgi:hypothetical protein